MIRLKGGMFDSVYEIVEGDRLLISAIEGRRVGPLQSATAWFVYSGATVVGVLALIGWSAVLMFKRRQRSQRV